MSIPRSDRDQDLLDSARAGGSSHRDRVLGHFDQAIQHIAMVAYHLSEAEGWWGFGELTDEMKGLADLLGDIRGRRATAEREL